MFVNIRFMSFLCSEHMFHVLYLYFLCFFYFIFFPGHILFLLSSTRHCGDAVRSATFRKLVCWRNAFANIPCWILYVPADVRSVFGLSVMHPVRVLIVRYMFVCCPSLIRRHFACWTEAVRCIFVTCTFQPFHVRWMYVRTLGFSTGLTFLPPDNKNSYPFHVRRFNQVKCDRGFKLLLNNLKIILCYSKSITGQVFMKLWHSLLYIS